MPLPPSAYPMLGLRTLLTTRSLHKKLFKFAAATGAAFAATAGLLLRIRSRRRFTFSWHRQVIGHVVPFRAASALLAPLVIAAEAALPVYVGAGSWLRLLQGQLFDQVLATKGVKVARLPADDLAWVSQRVDEQRRARRAQPMAVRIARQLSSSLLSYAPLSALPPFGPVLSLALGSYEAGEHYLRHYMRLKGLTGEARDVLAGQHTWAVRQFGVAAAALDALPLASWLTVFSNTVGAALWAADLERAGGLGVRRQGGAAAAGGARKQL